MTGFSLNNWLTTHKALQIFNIGRFSASMLTGLLLVNIGLPIVQLDNYELFFFYSSAISFFWITGFQQAFLSYYVKLKEEKRNSFKGMFFLLISLLSIVSAILLYFIIDFIGDVSTFTSASKSLLWLLLAFTAITPPSYFIHLLFLLEDKPTHILRFGIINFSLQLLIVVLTVAIGYSLYDAMLLLVGFAFLRLLYGAILFFRKFTWKFEFIEILPVILISLPLILHSLMGRLSEYIDGYLVEQFFTEDGIFAIYRYGAKELPFVLLIISSLESALIPVISANRQEGLQQIKTKTKKLAHFFFPVSILLLFASKPLYVFFYGEAFELSAQVFNIYILIVCSRILLPQMILIVQKDRYFLIISTVIEATVNVMLSLVFLQEYGIIGIAYATVIANMLSKLIMIVFNYFKLKIKPSEYIPFKTIALYSVLLVATFIVHVVYIS